MNNRALTLSVVMAILAVFFVQSYVQSIEEDFRKKNGNEVLVVTAKRDIKEMETVMDGMFTLSSVPAKYKQPGVIEMETKSKDPEVAKKEAAVNLGKLDGSIIVVPIKRGEQITYSMITEPGMRTGLSPQVSPGKRGFSIPVSDVTGVGKLVKPGDRVDVVGVIDMGSGKANRVARTLLQDVAVLATGRNVNNNVARTVEADPFGGKDRIRSLADDPSFNTVTLEVDPAQAQMLALILAGGDTSLMISLRNNDDTERTNLAGVTMGDVLGPDKARMPASQK